MRFAFVSTMDTAPWGGSEELWSQSAIRLKQEGHQVYASVDFRTPVPSPVVRLMEKGIQVSLHASRWESIARKIRKRASHFGRGRHAELLRFRPDLVVISQGYIGGDFRWAKTCREAGIPYIIIVHCNSEIWWFQDKLDEALAAYRGARVVYCVSQKNLDLLSLQLGEELPHTAVVRNPYNVFPDHSLTWPPENETWRLACVARLDPAAKGHDILLQIMDRPEWRKRPVELNLYGQGPDEPVLRRIISKLALTNVNLRGHVSDIASIWDNNHILVLPSRYEGLPIVLVEAMWCGRTAVVTDIGGNAELLTDDRTGFVAPAPTLDSFHAALERAWQRRAEWRTMGLAARDYVKTQIPQDPIAVFCEQLQSAVLQSRESVHAGINTSVGVIDAPEREGLGQPK